VEQVWSCCHGWSKTSSPFGKLVFCGKLKAALTACGKQAAPWQHDGLNQIPAIERVETFAWWPEILFGVLEWHGGDK
jgi:hypothetical protein